MRSAHHVVRAGGRGRGDERSGDPSGLGIGAQDGQGSPLLECHDLTKSFGEVRAVDGIDLNVRSHERLGVIGPNGSGKTTLFNCLSGFHAATSGVVLWNGVDVTGWSPQRRARHGLVRTFQQVAIFGELTVRDSVERASLCVGAIGRKRHRGDRSGSDLDVDRILSQCNLVRFADRKVSALAYGTQKLVNVAMALATGPSLLMLDEPAAGLSADEAVELGGVLALVAELGMTICLVDHNMPFVSAFCSRVVVLDAGSILVEGTPSEVRQDAEVRRVYLGGHG